MSFLFRPSDSACCDDDLFLRAAAAAEVSAADAAAVAGRKHWGRMWVAAETAAGRGEECEVWFLLGVQSFVGRVCCWESDVLMQRGMRLCRWSQTALRRGCSCPRRRHVMCWQRMHAIYQREQQEQGHLVEGEEEEEQGQEEQ